MVETRVVVLQALQPVVRRFERLVRHHQHGDALLEFDLGDFRTLFIQQKRGNLDRHLDVHGRRVVLQALFLNDAQNLQGAGFGVADVAGTAATRAGNRRPFRKRRFQPLATHFHQTELADRAELHAGAVLPQRIAQAAFNFATVLALVHVDEVDDDQAAQIAQAHLARDFVSGFQVGAGRGFLDVTALDGARRVHVDRHQCLGVVDHDRAAAWQLHRAGVGRFDLVLDLEA